jgi:glucuronate isomerase
MKKFLDQDFLLKTKSAQRLYHDYAKGMPVVDYHNHLPPDQIARDTTFENLTQAWLYGDHYKWRAMRTNGVDESYCTGNKNDFDKFMMWAKTVPYTLRNPLYHWTHLELQRYFDIHELLSETSAERIYADCSAKLRSPAFSVCHLFQKMNVQLVCTTDDPVDSLEHHQVISQQSSRIIVLPAFRPDRAMYVEDAVVFNGYLSKLEAASGLSIHTYSAYLEALKKRHDFFSAAGCTVSDHGLEQLCSEEYTDQEIKGIFEKIRSGRDLTPAERLKFRSAVLEILAEWNFEKGWVQQYHLGALRNNNSRMMAALGADTGWDSIGDFSQAKSLGKFLDRLDKKNKLTKTILYNLNPADNEVMASMAGNFNDGSLTAKVQWGSAWWFLDQKDGMTRQLNTLSNMGLLSRFVGMLTDSRSFLSFPRHEYFRRILCNLLGEDMENGELPNDMEWIGKIVKDICYYNAVDYFNWKERVDAGRIPPLS